MKFERTGNDLWDRLANYHSTEGALDIHVYFTNKWMYIATISNSAVYGKHCAYELVYYFLSKNLAFT